MDQIYPLPSSRDRILSSITFLSSLYIVSYIFYRLYLSYFIYKSALKSLKVEIINSDWSSSNANVCLFVCPAQVCLEHLLQIHLAGSDLQEPKTLRLVLNK